MMTNPTPKRFRPRFSIRTLIILVTLVCVYFASWSATNRLGCDQVLGQHWDDVNAESPMPFVVVRKVSISSLESGVFRWDTRRTYYFWFFGYVAKLPWEREVETENSPVLPRSPGYY
jgi:hypothetical protein